MVCPRCIEAVMAVLDEQSVAYYDVQLGKVNLPATLSDQVQAKLEQQLEKKGFQVLPEKNQALVEQIKVAVIEHVHYPKGNQDQNLSSVIASELNKDYAQLSRLFSSVEGITIEKFAIKQRIEKIKELLVYDQLSIAEIAFQLGLSSGAYLSSLFKKETGMTPKAFKQMAHQDRTFLDRV